MIWSADSEGPYHFANLQADLGHGVAHVKSHLAGVYFKMLQQILFRNLKFWLEKKKSILPKTQIFED